MREDLISSIAICVLFVILLFADYILSREIDKELYVIKAENKKTIKLKYFKWLFLRYDRKKRNEIFLHAFICEAISIVLLIFMTPLLVNMFFDSDIFKAIVAGSSIASSLGFALYLTITIDRIKKRNKQN